MDKNTDVLANKGIFLVVNRNSYLDENTDNDLHTITKMNTDEGAGAEFETMSKSRCVKEYGFIREY